MKLMRVFLAVSLLIFFLAADFAHALEQDKGQEYLARWQINYAHYLIEVGKYLEALENYDSAFELTNLQSTKIDALLSKAALLASFLDAPEEAQKVYQDIVKNYPEGAEAALYREGLVLFDLDEREEARQVLNRYLDQYPEGRFRFQAEALLEVIKRAEPIKVTPTEGERPLMRVRICKNTQELTLQSSTHAEITTSDGVDCGRCAKISLEAGQLLITGKRSGNKAIQFTSTNPIDVGCKDEKKTLRGEVRVVPRGDRFTVINFINIEDYLLSVVPAESLASWPLESLKAQAVAARSYAYYQKLHRKDWDYDVVDYEGDQVYGGVDREHKQTTEAVRATEGKVLTVSGRPVLAMYTANSGGYTADAGSIFGISKPYLIAKSDPESLKGQMASWTRSYSVPEIETALKAIGMDLGAIKDIQPAKKTESGRITKVNIESVSGTSTLNTRTTLLRALRLPEILFQIDKLKNGFIFKGRGFGHGVGYSQWGSAAMGSSKSYSEILQFYYPGTQMEKRW